MDIQNIRIGDIIKNYGDGIPAMVDTGKDTKNVTNKN